MNTVQEADRPHLRSWGGNVLPGKSNIGEAYGKYAVLERLPQMPSIGNRMLASCPTSYFMQLSKTWDRGTRTIREKILQEFVTHNRNKTGPQLEREFSNGASLFLTRLSAYLRLSYLLGHSLALQLQAINIFISASSGHRFLAEFLEVGGVLTVLEILGLAQVKEPDKAEALRVLLSVAQAGRRYKEFICESYGVRAVADCLGRSRSEITQDYARNLLHQLGVGNPKFLMQVYKSLLSLLTSQGPPPTSQQMAGQALRLLLPSIQAVHPSIVEATVALLKNPHIQIQYEGYEILRELFSRTSLQDVIITQLITILKTSVEDTQEDLPEERRRRAKGEKSLGGNQWGNLIPKGDEGKAQSESIAAGYMQQAYAAKLLGVMAAANRELAERMIDAQIVSGLLSVIANVGHTDSQHYAASALIVLVGLFDFVGAALREHMGKNFFELLEDKPDKFYKELNREQVRYLRRNNVQIHAGPDANAVSESDDGVSSDEENDEATAKTRSRPKSGRTPHSAGSRGTAPATPFDMFPATRDGDSIRSETKQQEEAIAGPAEQEPSKPATAIKIEQMVEPEERIPPPAVQDLYVPFAQPVVNATFSARKFGKADNIETRETFDADLEKFRANELGQKRDTRKEEAPVDRTNEQWLLKMKNADFHDIKLAVSVDSKKSAQKESDASRPSSSEMDGTPVRSVVQTPLP
ncbi:hypothetical protein HKX48_004984 [Thoreauomyces humboldtii]|nr:hypothetical protein HKX48_004984 [Thoreauomyces humboldtii]